MRVVSFKSKILLLVIGTAFATGVLLLGGLFAILEIRNTDRSKSVQDTLIATGSSQANSFLVGYLIPEQSAGFSLMLDRIKTEEGLDAAEILTPEVGSLDFPDCKLTTVVSSCFNRDKSKLAVVLPVADRDRVYGYLLKAKTLQGSADDFFPLAALFLGLSGIGFTVVFFFLARTASFEIPEYLSRLVRWLERVLNGGKVLEPPTTRFKELNDLGNKVSEIIHLHQKMRQENLRLWRQAAIADFAAQVAHDIRSPLAALEMAAIHSAHEIPEEKRILIRAALGRIRDIANHLIEHHRALKKEELHGTEEELANEKEPMCVELMPSIVESLVSEKRMQYRSRIDLQIEARLAAGYGMFAKVQKEELKRVLSNLINNSVEAISSRGSIDVDLSGDKDWIEIRVKDSGCGVPKSILPKVMERGFSYRKPEGSGLGLYHARECARAWGGSLSFSSEVDRGTTVALTLPRAKNPTWFLPNIRIEDGMEILILDDDISIHRVWQKRLEEISVSSIEGVHIIHCSTPEDFIERHRQSSAVRRLS